MYFENKDVPNIAILMMKQIVLLLTKAGGKKFDQGVEDIHPGQTAKAQTLSCQQGDGMTLLLAHLYELRAIGATWRRWHKFPVTRSRSWKPLSSCQ